MTTPAQYDVVIIGAGVNGAGIARDAAMRGLKVLIVDKNDMCSGTSAISSRLIHGGLRYLEYAEIPLVYESLRERRCLQHIASHLVKPLRISIPIFSGARRGPLLIRLGMIAYDVLSFRKKIPGHEMLSSDEIQEQEPGLRKDGLRAAARYSDAQVTFAERLILENLLAAQAAGAEVKTYSTVTSIEACDGKVSAITYEDRAGERHEVSVATVINASGPWVDEVLKLAPRPAKRFVGGTKGSHIIVGKFNGAPQDAFYVEAAADGRPFFIIPWNDLYLIGTTDIRYEDSLDEIRASKAEVDYLIEETNRVFPQAALTAREVHYAYAGVRPLPHRKKGPESAITRRHIIEINRRIARGLVSIIGGKLTTYRNLAEQTVDKLARLLQKKLPDCRTQDTLLPGAWGVDRAREALIETGLWSATGVQRLLDIYGGRAAAIAELAVDDSQLAAPLDATQTVLAAEIAFTIREEFPVTLIDVIYRRTMLGFNADQGRALYELIADTASTEFGWTPAERESELTALHAYSDSLRVSEFEE
jgi:glycerol-3-phosphate dehydrogenase